MYMDNFHEPGIRNRIIFFLDPDPVCPDRLDPIPYPKSWVGVSRFLSRSLRASKSALALALKPAADRDLKPRSEP